MIKHYCPVCKKWRLSKLFERKCKICNNFFQTNLEIKKATDKTD